MKKSIAFVTAGLDFNGNSLKEKALGGSESAMIYMARELAKLGHVVSVYCVCSAPGKYDGVTYSTVEEFKKIRSKLFDVLIVSRYLPLQSFAMVSNLTIAWMHDVYHADFFAGYLHLLDKIFLLSKYQKKLYVEANEHLEQMIHVTSNGFDSDLASSVDILPFVQKKNNYIYSARPERGLAFLLDSIWPRIKTMNPDAVLHICGYENPFEMPPEIAELYAKIDELIAGSTGVVRVGNLDKAAYFKMLGQCAYMVYPCDFPEVSCINAMESQAMGCLVISSNSFAFPETVKSNTLIYGTSEEEYIAKFLATVEDYQDEKKFNETTTIARTKVFDQYAWINVAKSWDEKIDSMFEERYTKYTSQVFKRLEHNSDLVTLSKVDPTFDTEYISHIVADNAEFTYFVSMIGTTTIPDGLNELELNGRHVEMVDHIKSHIRRKPNKKFTMLEVGSYDGAISGTVYKACADNIEKVIAYDCRQAPLDAYKTIWGRNPQCTNIETICDDVLNIKNHSLKADIIVVAEILEHIIDYKSMLEDIQRCANPGALVYFSTPIGPWSSIEKKQIRELHREQHIHHYELADLHTIFQDHMLDNKFFITSIPLVTDHRGEVCGNYMFGYYNYVEHGFHEYDYVGKARKMRPYFSVSVCMIVKNAENDLFRCLNSVAGISDEIIIVDTGSTDRSKGICAAFTNKIYDLQWEEADRLGSFERARNYSLDQATGDYILYIDADEELLNGADIGNFIRSEYIQSNLMLQKQILLDDISGKQDQWVSRLFKRGALRFQGVIHETAKQDPNNKNPLFEIKLPHQLSLRHYGYLDTRVREQKWARNHSLLLKNITKYPYLIENHLYNIRDMLHAFHFSKDKQFLLQAVKLWEKYPCDFTKPQYVNYWRSTFDMMQTAYALLLNDNLGIKTKKIGKESLLYVDAEDLKIYKKYRSK